jgi:hypothetical protein
MNRLEQVAAEHHAFERTDKSQFQRRARLLQSLWREQQGLPVGEHRRRKLGSRLPMPEAETHLWNFVSEKTKDVVREEVLGPTSGEGKLYGRPRIFNDLLSSQPLCFNLFAELQCNLPLATNVMRAVSDGRIQTVTSVQFEHSPGRGDARYLGDRSAFDVFVTFDTPSGGRGFVGIEVKYHEHLLGEAATHRERYDEVAALMDCFGQERQRLREQPLQQLWRDHMLAGILRHEAKYADGFFMLLYPAHNLHCQRAVDSYRVCLTSTESFQPLTLERFAEVLKEHGPEKWASRIYDRYVDFTKIDALL